MERFQYIIIRFLKHYPIDFQNRSFLTEIGFFISHSEIICTGIFYLIELFNFRLIILLENWNELCESEIEIN